MSSTKIRNDIYNMRKELQQQKEQLKEEHRIERQRKISNRRDPKWSMFYDSKAWKKLRKHYITTHPLCENHLRYDINVPATQVHHKLIWGSLPNDEDKWNAFLNEDNLMSLCTKCHNEFHNIANNEGLNYIDHCTIEEMEEW